MHLLIPFASALSQEALQVLPALPLPNLVRLLARLTPQPPDAADAYTLSPPHERALAAAWGWHGADGALPFAARAAAADGIAVQGRAWGLATPVHWHVARDHVALVDPDAIGLGEDESRTLFEGLRDLFESEGYGWFWGAPGRWYVAHPSLAGMRCAALDRVIGRNVDFWLGAAASSDSGAARIRRLQSEVQLSLHAHPLNEAREARGQLALNSFWLSGCGAPQPADTVAIDVDERLRSPLLGGDAAGWAAAWAALDAGPVARLLERAEAAERPVSLTLCGERAWQRFEHAPRSLWRRLRARMQPQRVHELLAGL